MSTNSEGLFWQFTQDRKFAVHIHPGSRLVPGKSALADIMTYSNRSAVQFSSATAPQAASIVQFAALHLSSAQQLICQSRQDSQPCSYGCHASMLPGLMDLQGDAQCYSALPGRPPSSTRAWQARTRPGTDRTCSVQPESACQAAFRVSLAL